MEEFLSETEQGHGRDCTDTSCSKMTEGEMENQRCVVLGVHSVKLASFPITGSLMNVVGVGVVVCVIFVCCTRVCVCVFVCVFVCEIIFFLCIDIGRMKRGWLGWIEQVFLHKRSLFVVLCIVSQKVWKLKSRFFKSLNRYGTQKHKRRGVGKEEERRRTGI